MVVVDVVFVVVDDDAAAAGVGVGVGLGRARKKKDRLRQATKIMKLFHRPDFSEGSLGVMVVL